MKKRKILSDWHNVWWVSRREHAREYLVGDSVVYLGADCWFVGFVAPLVKRLRWAKDEEEKAR